MLIKRLATILLIIVFAIEAAFARDNDSTAVATRDCCEAIAGVPLLALGVGLHLADNGYHSRIDDGNTIAHKSTLDNIAQYSPGALMLALKAAGIESRSSWGRMLTADAFAAAIYLGATESVKRIANTRRPDQTDCRSFPSGHSAMAFLCATMLHKEYGGVSPWYSLGGYTAATATAMARVLNNRHWQEDVLTGAAIGVISTHLGYLISDLINKFLDKNYYVEASRSEYEEVIDTAKLYLETEAYDRKMLESGASGENADGVADSATERAPDDTSDSKNGNEQDASEADVSQDVTDDGLERE